jgi:geranylgeranyl diphosphate synthase type II
MDKRIEELKATVRADAEKIEKELDAYLTSNDEDIARLFDAQRYSVLDGGKRIRPFLVNEFCRLFGGDEKVSMAYACAIEMIHNYSLIHDDLPCMDDDDLRRGRPSAHKAFGYATALLAGDALLTRAFRTIAENDKASAEQNAKAVALLAKASGDYGMIGGQIMDLQGETEELDMETLLKVQAMKTGALMECSARLGALAAGFDTDTKESEIAGFYARKIGLAFQVVDDIIDIDGDQAEIGKNIRSDVEHNKTTFMTYYTSEEARVFAAELTAEAVSAIAGIEGSETLTDLAAYLVQRTA